MHAVFFHGHKASHAVNDTFLNLNFRNVIWKDDACDHERAEYDCVSDRDVLSHYKTYKVPRRNWHWINCDAGILTHLKLHPEQLSNREHVWLFEWDARWSNNLTEILDAFREDGSDLLCPHLRENDRWFHAARRDTTRYPTFAHCEQSAMRVSTRLLRHAFRDMARYPMFCEMRLPSICKLHDWCTMRDLTYKSKYMGVPFQWPRITNMSHVRRHSKSLLFHRVKS